MAVFLVCLIITPHVSDIDYRLGGAWFLSSQSGNNWPTVTYLKTTLWEVSVSAFQMS